MARAHFAISSRIYEANARRAADDFNSLDRERFLTSGSASTFTISVLAA